jgi:hypothetical protein
MRRSRTRARSIKRWGLVAVFLTIGLVNLLRGGLVLRFAPALEGYEIAMSPVLLVGFYWVWAVLLSVEAVVCLLRARCYARPVALAYQATLWVVRLISDRTTAAEGVGLQNAVLSLLFILLIWFLSSQRTGRQTA